MYTYLSAVAGAPAPPLPDSASSSSSSSLPPPTSQASHVSPMHTPLLPPLLPSTTPTVGLSLSSPRLPVFAQFQQQPDSNALVAAPSSETVPTSQSDSQSSIPMSVIQDTRLPSSASSTDRSQFPLQPRDEATGAPTLSHLPPLPQTAPMGEITPANIENLAADVASHVSSFFSHSSVSVREPPTSEASAVLSTANLADHLAQELARAVSQLVPTSSDSGLQPTSSQLVPNNTTTTTVAVTTASASSLTVQSRHLQPQSMQSPSPSDTLAPLLMTSLQMPQSGNGTETSTGRTETQSMMEATPPPPQTGLELQSAESRVQQETPANFVTVSSGVTIAHPSNAHPTSAASLTLTPDSGGLGTTVGSPLGSAATVAAPTSSSETTSTSATAGLPDAASSLEVAVTKTGSPTPSSLSAGEGSSTLAIAASNSSSQSASLSPTASQSDQQQQQQQQQPSESQAESQAQAAQASSEQNQLPDIDPSFLAALPDSIRQEVLSQHEREQRRLRAQRESALTTTISPEFLAALPLNIQEEVYCINVKSSSLAA